MRGVRHPLLILTVVACCAAVMAILLSPRWTAQKFAGDLHERILEADEAQAARLVGELAKLDDAALRPLVHLLDDDRQSVRIAAREGLQQKLATWSEARSSASEQSLALLAQTLAKSPMPRDLHSRIFAKLTALKLLRYELQSSEIDRVAYLAHCSQILEKTISTPSESPAVSNAKLEPPTLPDSAEIEPPPDYQEGPAMELVREEAELAPIVSSDGLVRPRPRTIDSEELPVAPVDIGNPIDSEALQSLSTRSLMRHLHGVPELASAAENELRRRGLADATLKLARALDHPNPAIRQDLAESLPGIAGIDPSPWLWELAEDENEDVRRAARNILATSNNPQTKARVGRLK